MARPTSQNHVNDHATRTGALSVALCFAFALLAPTTSFTGAAAQPAQPAQPAQADTLHVLLLGSRPSVDSELQRRLAEQGFNVVCRSINLPLTDEMLRKFHVVVLESFQGTSIEMFLIVPYSIMQEQLTMQRNITLLHPYVEAGGGILVMPYMLGSGTGSAESVSEFLAPYGAKLHPLQVRDTEHIFDCFAYTTNIAQHPATEGVRRIYYPQNMLRWDDGYATPAFELVDANWTPLVRGMPGSYAAQGFDYTKWEPSEFAAPPLAAARTAGNGRVGLLAVNTFYVFRYPFRTVQRGWIGEANVGDIDGVFIEKGDGENPSDGFALIAGMLRWLGEAARENGLGGYDEESFKQLPLPEMPEVPEWLRTWQPDTGALPHKVLVGARTQFSDGSGTVAQHAQAAREAGISLLVLTETFEHFAPERWLEFVRACAAASDESLAVVPGVDIADQHGTRYLYFGKGMLLPKRSLLTPDGKKIVKTQYFSLGLGVGVMVAHRTGSQLHHPHQLLKHYSGMSVLTYRNGRLIDDAREQYAWQINSYSNPIPFVVHEVYSPAELKAAAATGCQLYVMAPGPAAAAWYLGEISGIAHFYEDPLRMQISAGPLITEFRARNFLRIDSKEPLAEVLLYDKGEVIRRWTPNDTSFTLPSVKLPDGHKTWTHLHATDARGNSMISPGILSGRDSKWGYTWRCGDRQNWTHPFPNIYTGQDILQFNVRVPGAVMPGELAAVNEFRLASWVTYVSDVLIEHCYPDAKWNDYARDAKPVPRTVSIEGYRGRVRFRQFYHPGTINWMRPHPNNMPTLKEIQLELLQPLKPQGAIFPQIVNSGARPDYSREPTHAGTDRTYAYIEPRTGEEVRGELKEGFIDLPSGGRIGGLIALSGGLRVDVRGNVGFAAPDDADADYLLPAGTSWRAAFVTVNPEDADRYRRLMGLAGPPPYKLELDQGGLERIHYVAYMKAEGGGIRGVVAEPYRREYLLPVAVGNVNPNWEAAIWRPGGVFRQIPIFEGEAWARLDVGVEGEFYIGHTVTADSEHLHLGVLHWSADRIEIEVHNSTDDTIEAEVRTAEAIADRKQCRTLVTVPPGSSQVITGR